MNINWLDIFYRCEKYTKSCKRDLESNFLDLLINDIYQLMIQDKQKELNETDYANFIKQFERTRKIAKKNTLNGIGYGNLDG